MKFNDLDADGTRDAGEPGLPGWTINLYQDTGTIGSYDGEPVFASAVTDANGDYSFQSLLAGNYIVCEVLQATWEQSAPTSAPAGETLVTNCPGPYEWLRLRHGWFMTSVTTTSATSSEERSAS